MAGSAQNFWSAEKKAHGQWWSPTPLKINSIHARNSCAWWPDKFYGGTSTFSNSSPLRIPGPRRRKVYMYVYTRKVTRLQLYPHNTRNQDNNNKVKRLHSKVRPIDRRIYARMVPSVGRQSHHGCGQQVAVDLVSSRRVIAEHCVRERRGNGVRETSSRRLLRSTYSSG